MAKRSRNRCIFRKPVTERAVMLVTEVKSLIVSCYFEEINGFLKPRSSYNRASGILNNTRDTREAVCGVF